jgi:hypothetical protein
MITKKPIPTNDLENTLNSLDKILNLNDGITMFSLGLKYNIINYRDIIGSTFYTHLGQGTIKEIDIKYGRTKKPERRIIVAYEHGREVYQFNPDEFKNDGFSKIEITEFVLEKIRNGLLDRKKKKLLPQMKELNYKYKGQAAKLVYSGQKTFFSLNPEHFLSTEKKINVYYSYLFDYYSQYGIENADPSEIDIDNRQKILNFKSGYENIEILEKVSGLVNFYFLKEDLKDIILLPIPASTSYKNEKRFKDFLEYIADTTGIINGYDLIESTANRPETHNGFKRNNHFSIADIKIADEIKDKNVIIFDDIITTGNQFRQVAAKIRNTGGSVLMGMFLGQTVKVGK